jgi:hypothetical protein
MNAMFPFELPGATAWYETLYVLTFALHQALMHYVLAGSLLVAWAMIFPGRGRVPRAQLPVVAVVRDWMPFMLSAAITAGVAPLLFVQILYRQQFYTANLLLSWRWMIVIPVLVVVFYLLYVLKMDFLSKRGRTAQSLVAAAVAVGVVFVGFCWTANYLLSTDEPSWPEVYATGRLPFTATHVIVRMLVWIGGSLVSLAVIVGWQLGTWHRGGETSERADPDARLLGWLALEGLDTFVVSGAAALWWSVAPVRTLLWSVVGWPWLLVLMVGLTLLYVAWFVAWRSRRLGRLLIVTATAGWVLSLVATGALREVGRVAVLNMEDLAQRHAEAVHVGGLAVFLVFAVINGAAIAWCIWVVRQRRKGITRG